MIDSGAGEDARQQAVKRIKRKRMFQQQLILFVLINVLLWVIWAATGAGFPWPIFVTVFWSIGIATQAWAIYRGARRSPRRRSSARWGRIPAPNEP